MKLEKEDKTRKFAGDRSWKLWDGPRLAGVAPGPVLYYDDPDLAGTPVEWYVGIEVHKRVLLAAIYGRAGEARVLGPILREGTAPAERATLWDQVARFRPARFLMETTGVFHVPVAWELQDSFPGAQVVVMSAYELSKYVQRTRKSDRIDAARLAQVASVGELLRPSNVPAPPAWVLREHARYREARVREVTRQKNRIKKVMSAFGWHWDLNFQSGLQVRFLEDFLAQGLPLGDFVKAQPGHPPEGELNCHAPWASVCLSPDARDLLLLLLRDLRVCQELEALSAAQVVTRAKAFPGVQTAVGHLEGFPGLGFLETLFLAAEVGDAGRFSDSGRFLVYAGIAPAGGTSGVRVAGDVDEKVVARDKPNPRCNRRMRKVLTRVAVAILRDCTRTPRKDDLYQYARAWKVRGDVLPMRRVYKIAAKVGRKLFHVLRAGVSYDGAAERAQGVGNRGAGQSRQARRQQAYRKAWQARTIAERTVEALLSLLRERGAEPEALEAIAAASARVEQGNTAGGRAQ